MKDRKTKLHPAIKIASVAAVLLIGGGLLLKRFQIDISVTSAAPNQVPVIQTVPSPAERSGESPRAAKTTPEDLSEKPDPALAAGRQGSLRISNRSDHPLRVALRVRQAKDGTAKASSPQTGFAAPAHWDFAPGEGSEKGLLVSLPDRSVRLKRGDVVVAFAQDGSQRYWGPFVVGETDQPTWNSQTAEWELSIGE